MRTFSFRAAAALALRQRQEDDAALRLARGHHDLQAAKDEFARAQAARDAGRDALARRERAGIDEGTRAWHRNWIVHLAAHVDQAQALTQRQAVIVVELQRAWHDARRRRMALERLRDRAWQRHRRAEARLEQLEIDELARLRTAMPDDTGEGDTS